MNTRVDPLALTLLEPLDRLGLKGPRAGEWLVAQGVVLPMAPNSWTYSNASPADEAGGAQTGGARTGGAQTGAAQLLVARLGAGEFFLEDGPGGTAIQRMAAPCTPAAATWAPGERAAATRAPGERPAGNQPGESHPPGVYPVLREDWALQLGGDGVHEVLAQVCNVNFAAMELDARPVIMTLMIGVAVLVVPQAVLRGREYRIWCDPTFGPYLAGSLGTVVKECGGRYTGDSN